MYAIARKNRFLAVGVRCLYSERAGIGSQIDILCDFADSTETLLGTPTPMTWLGFVIFLRHSQDNVGVTGLP
jgi:hypothetical protein